MAVPWQAKNSTQRGILQPGRDDVLTHDDAQRGLDKGVFDWTGVGYEGRSLENWLQHWVAAVSDIEASLVRPRWQPTPTMLPDITTPCWIATGITRKKPQGQWSYTGHNGVPEAGQFDRPGEPGRDQMIRWEDFELLVTWYGPECEVTSENFYSGCMVWQNRVVLRLVGLALVEVGEQIRAPEMIKEQWLDRVDRTVFFRRVVQRSYPVFNLIHAHGVIQLDRTGGDYRVPFSTP